MRRGLAAAAALLALGVLALPGAAPAAESVANHLIVGFKKNVSNDRQNAIVKAVKAKIHRRFGSIHALVLIPKKGSSRDALRNAIRRYKEVRYAEPDFILNSSKTPNDPSWPSQYSLATGGAAFVNAPNAWSSRTSCSKVGVLDTGIQTNHPDLKENVYANPNEINSNGKDDDKNGYVDDYYGFNVIAGKGNGTDDNGHGTHVAGIIAGRGNNGMGITGLCWTARLIPIKFLNSQGKGSVSDAISGIDYAIKIGLRIVNCSFGSPSNSSALQDEVNKAKSKNLLLVVAAGNDGDNIDKTPTYPASYTNDNILTVAAITSSGALASFSNFGSTGVDLAAPGDKILSTYPTSTYKKLSGTSMAAPLVAAAAAMLRQQNGDYSYSQLRSAIKSHVRKTSALSGKVATGGQLDIYSALKSVPPPS